MRKDNIIYKQGDYVCDKCHKKIDFILEFKDRQEKNAEQWREFYQDELCGIKLLNQPRKHGDIYAHGHCLFKDL